MSTDLDVATPEETAQVLRTAADEYRAASSELASAWQDRQAGKVWNDFATILERAAHDCEKALRKRGL